MNKIILQGVLVNKSFQQNLHIFSLKLPLVKKNSAGGFLSKSLNKCLLQLILFQQLTFQQDCSNAYSLAPLPSANLVKQIK